MIVVLYGADDFTIRESLNQIKADCSDDALGVPDTTWLDGSRLTPSELLAGCNTFSFLTPKRLVVAEGLLGRFETKGKKGKGKGKSPELKQWESLTENPLPESTVLVFKEGNLSKTNPLLKKLASVAQIRECPLLELKALPDWIQARVQANGAEIDPQARTRLIQLISNNLWILSNEIDKLCQYTAGRRITEADVNDLVSNAREMNVFYMVDTIIQRRQGEALKQLHQHFAEGAAPAYLLYMITAEFRLLLQAKTLKSQGVPVKEIANKTGEHRDWKLEKMLRQSAGYAVPRLENTYRRLLQADLDIKTGKTEGQTALDLLIADLCKR